jgi:hypothetical protein
VTINLEIEWRPYQSEFIRWVISPAAKGTTTAVKAPRQVGKTTVLTAVLLYYACNFKNGFSILMEPTNKQCGRVFAEMKNLLDSTGILKSANQSSMILEFVTGSKIQFLSGESDIAAFQGYVVKNGVLCIDEAAFITDDVFYALTPTTDVHRCPIILTSTPRFRNGFFYDYFVEGVNNQSNTVKSRDWAGLSILTPEKLDFYKRTLPERLFRNYYLGEFSDAVGSVFGSFNHVLSNDFDEPTYYKMKWEKNIDCYMGVDWGTGQGQDYTAVSIFNSNNQQIYIEHFNDLDETQTIRRIVDIVKLYKPKTVQYEINGIGAIFGGLLKKAIYAEPDIETTLKQFSTSNTSKNKLVNKMLIAIQNNEVQLLNDERLVNEMTTYQLETTQTGKVTYNAAKGCHDDLVIATLLAFDLSTLSGGGMYNVI